MPETVGYLLLFTGVGVAFILVNLTVGKFLRPAKMTPEKATIYECGEPTIGSAWVQFDLRFYVVALLFVIFDVEMAFFFPWAVVFGKANQLADKNLPADTRTALTKEMTAFALDPAAREAEQRTRLKWFVDRWEEDQRWYETKLREPQWPEAQKEKWRIEQAEHFAKRPTADSIRFEAPDNSLSARRLAWVAFFDILFFFGVLLVGFAYLWKRGDLDWVRSLSAQRVEEVALDKDRRRSLAVLMKD